MKKTKKKETTLSVLKEIRDLLKQQTAPVVTNVSDFNNKDVIYELPNDEIKIYIPSVTAKEIKDRCNNKTSKGTPFIWSTWWDSYDFFTKEKTREGRYIIGKNLIEGSTNKTWHEQEILLKEKGGIRLNLAEMLYILYAYEKQTGIKLLEDKYYWTSSLKPAGDLLYVGDFGSVGVDGSGWYPDRSDGIMGVSLSRRCNLE
jgi:hypothetical protein